MDEYSHYIVEIKELGETEVGKSLVEVYLSSLIKTIIYSAMYMRIINNPLQSLNILDKFRNVARNIEKQTTNPLLYHLLAKYYLTYGIIFLDMGKFENSKEYLINSVALFEKECVQRLKYVTIISMISPREMYELRRMIDLSVCLFYNCGLLFQEKKSVALFCFRYCKWFCANIPCLSKELFKGFEDLVSVETENVYS